jgi:hypothetical protein
MYLREAKQKRTDGSVVTYLQRAENVWNTEKRRSETHILCNFGRADDAAVTERLRRPPAATSNSSICGQVKFPQ